MRLYRIAEKIYKFYRGEVTVAIVVGNTCTHSFVYSPTGAVWRSNYPGRDEWQGSSVEELKANGFTYTGANVVYRNEAGNEYWYEKSAGLWHPEEPEGEYDIPESAITVVHEEVAGE